MSPFQKGHKGFSQKESKNKGKADKNKKSNKNQATLDTFFITSKFKSKKRPQFLDSDKVSYYINNDLDLGDLLDEEDGK